MSEFDEMMAEGFAQFAAAVGTVVAKFRATTIAGTITDLSADEKLTIGGAVPNVKQTFMFAKVEFSPPIRTGEYLEIAGRKLRIGLIQSDETTIELFLCDRNE